jgi:hypothetical protein
MVETWSADTGSADFIAAGCRGCCAAEGSRSLSSLDFPNIARSLFCVGLAQNYEVAPNMQAAVFLYKRVGEERTQ